MSETTVESGYEAVKVRIENLHELAGHMSPAPAPAPVRRGFRAHYETFVLTSNDPVQCILPEDENRVEAYVIALDNDIVIGPKGVVGAAANTVASVPQPQGTYIPAKTTGGALFPFPVKDCNAVFAGVTTSSNSRVSVAAYYRN